MCNRSSIGVSGHQQQRTKCTFHIKHIPAFVYSIIFHIYVCDTCTALLLSPYDFQFVDRYHFFLHFHPSSQIHSAHTWNSIMYIFFGIGSTAMIFWELRLVVLLAYPMIMVCRRRFWYICTCLRIKHFLCPVIIATVAAIVINVAAVIDHGPMPLQVAFQCIADIGCKRQPNHLTAHFDYARFFRDVAFLIVIICMPVGCFSIFCCSDVEEELPKDPIQSFLAQQTFVLNLAYVVVGVFVCLCVYSPTHRGRLT